MSLQNLYAISELAQRLLRDRAKSHGWVLETYPGKVKLPGDIFKPLPNPGAAREVSAMILRETTIGFDVVIDYPDRLPSRRRVGMAC